MARGRARVLTIACELPATGDCRQPPGWLPALRRRSRRRQHQPYAQRRRPIRLVERTDGPRRSARISAQVNDEPPRATATASPIAGGFSRDRRGRLAFRRSSECSSGPLSLLPTVLRTLRPRTGSRRALSDLALGRMLGHRIIDLGNVQERLLSRTDLHLLGATPCSLRPLPPIGGTGQPFVSVIVEAAHADLTRPFRD